MNLYQVARKFKYNGMELETVHGTDWYEMDMRQYDPAIARWTAIDPVTHHSQSTYTSYDNNPVFWADPSGADAVTYFGNNATWGEGFGSATEYYGNSGSKNEDDNNGDTDSDDADSQDSSSTTATTAANATTPTTTTKCPKCKTFNDYYYYYLLYFSSPIVQKHYKKIAKDAGNGLLKAVVQTGLNVSKTNTVTVNVEPSEKFWYGLGIFTLAVLEPGPGGESKIGKDIALGLSDDLFDFAKSKGFKTYKDFSTGIDIKAIESVMRNPKNRLHFNLNGFSRIQANKFNLSNTPIRYGNITNWEYNLIMNNPHILNRTTFYSNGSIVSPPQR